MRSLFTLLAGGCTGDVDDKSEDTSPVDTSVHVDTGSSTNPVDTGPVEPIALTIEVQAAPALNPEGVVPEGVCARLLDPSPALVMDAEVVELATATVGKQGRLSFVDVDTTSSTGLFVQLTDENCPTAPSGSVGISSNTLIPPARLAGLTDGDTLMASAFLFDDITLTIVAAQATVAATPARADLSQGGWLFGYVVSSDDPFTPILGATVGCAACTANETFYVDGGDSLGSWFGDGAANHPDTQAPLAAFVVSGAADGAATAESGTYVASAAGAQFDELVLRGFAGAIVIVPFTSREP